MLQLDQTLVAQIRTHLSLFIPLQRSVNVSLPYVVMPETQKDATNYLGYKIDEYYLSTLRLKEKMLPIYMP